MYYLSFLLVVWNIFSLFFLYAVADAAVILPIIYESHDKWCLCHFTLTLHGESSIGTLWASSTITALICNDIIIPIHFFFLRSISFDAFLRVEIFLFEDNIPLLMGELHSRYIITLADIGDVTCHFSKVDLLSFSVVCNVLLSSISWNVTVI